MLKSMPARIGHCRPKPGWGLKNIFKFVLQSLLLFHQSKPKDNKGISKYLRFCWQQLFGLLHNITIWLKSIRPNKTEIKIIAEKRLVYISAQARTFSLHHPVTTIPMPHPLSYRHCWETNSEILFIIGNRYCRRNERFPLHSSPHRKFQKCTTRVLIRPDTTFGDFCDRSRKN